MDLGLVLLLLYAIAFGALFMLREPAWLAGGTLLAALAVVGHFALGRNASGDAGLGVFIFGVVAAVGFASGGAARLTLLGLRGQESRRRTAAVGLTFLCGVPLLLAGWGQLQQAQHRARYAPPSEECRSRIHQLRLGDRDVRLPLVRGVTIRWGKESSQSVSTGIPEEERIFCERSGGGKMRVNNIAISLSQLGLDHGPAFRPVCRQPRSEAWWPLFCRFDRPERLELYGIYLSDPDLHPRHALPDYRVDRRIGQARPLDSRWERIGQLARLDMGHEIYWRGPRMPGGVSPWSARCYQNRGPAREPDGWRCKAGYLLTPRIALVYDFLTADDDVAAPAMRIERDVSSVAHSLIHDETKVPAAR